MSGFQGGCEAFERLVGAPHPKNGCCVSCEQDDDAGYPICEYYNDMDGPWPELPPDAWFSICCAHANAYDHGKTEKLRISSKATSEEL